MHKNQKERAEMPNELCCCCFPIRCGGLLLQGFLLFLMFNVLMSIVSVFGLIGSVSSATAFDGSAASALSYAKKAQTAAKVSGNGDSLKEAQDALEESGLGSAYDFGKDSVKGLKMLLFAYIVLAVIAIGVFWITITKLFGIVKGDYSLPSARDAIQGFNILLAYFFFFFVAVTAGLYWFMILSDGSAVVYGIMVSFIIFGVLNLVMIIWWRSPFAALHDH